MIVTIHQPEHLPWLGYFHKMALADCYVLLDNVQFRKNYFQNRNKIMGVNGPMWLTVPVSIAGHTDSILATTSISGQGNWRKKYWKSIQSSYSKHPFYPCYAEAIETIIFNDWQYLVDLNIALINFFAGVLGIEKKIIRASTLDVKGKRSELLLDICRATKATTYLAGPSGADYLDEELFRNANVTVTYHVFCHPEYSQLKQQEFTSHLSVLDLIFNHGPESYRILLGP